MNIYKILVFLVSFTFLFNFSFSSTIIYNGESFTKDIDSESREFDYIYEVFLGNDEYNIREDESGTLTINIKNEGNNDLVLGSDDLDFIHTDGQTTITPYFNDLTPQTIESKDNIDFEFKYNITDNSLALGNYDGILFFFNTADESQNISVPVRFILSPLSQDFNVSQTNYDSNLIVFEEEDLTIFKVRKGTNVIENNSGYIEFNVSNLGLDTLDIDVSSTDFSTDTTDLTFTNSFSKDQITKLESLESELLNFTFEVPEDSAVGEYFGNITFTNSFNESQFITKQFMINVTEEIDYTISESDFKDDSESEIDRTLNYESQIYELEGVSYVTNDIFERTFTIDNTGLVDMDVLIVYSDFNGLDTNSEIPIELDTTSFTVEAGESDTFSIFFEVLNTNEIDYYTSTINLTFGEENYNIKLNLNVSTLILGKLYNEDQIIFDAETDDDNVPFSFLIQNTGEGDIEDLDISIENGYLVGSDFGYTIEDSDFDFDFGDGIIEASSSRRISAEVDIDNDLLEDNYIGNILVKDNYVSVLVPINISVKTDTFDIEIDDNFFFERNDYFYMFANTKNIINEIDFYIENNGDTYLENVSFELEDLYHSSGEKISSEKFIFSSNEFSLGIDSRKKITIENEKIDVSQLGNYYGDLYVRNNDDILEIYKFRFELSGDIIIEDVEYDDSVSPGETLEVTLTIENIGVEDYDSIEIFSQIEEELGNKLSITDGTNKFSLESSEQKEIRLSFDIPEEFYGGLYNFEIKTTYYANGVKNDMSKFFNFNVLVDSNQINVYEVNLNKEVFSCDVYLYSSFKVKNEGKNDNNIFITSSIYGEEKTKQNTRTFSLNKLEESEFTFKHDISKLGAGDYQYSININFEEANKVSLSERKNFKIERCLSNTPVPTQNVEIEENDLKFYQKTTTYLFGALGLIFLGIILSLVFI